MDSRDSNSLALGSRGLGFQAAGFAVVGCSSAAALYLFAGSEHWAYQVFEICVVKLYWAFAVVLAAIFDKVRKMFETRAEIRRAMIEEGRAEGRSEGRDEGIASALSVVESADLPDDVRKRLAAQIREINGKG